jgi:two-component system sensor histidine kinase KdpD
LAGLRVSADALAMGGAELPAEQRAELLAGLRASAVRLDSVIGAVLDSSRIEAGVAVVEPALTDLAEVTARAVADFDSPRIQLDLPEPVPAVVDPVLLERIVANLLANALAHTPPESTVVASARSVAGRGEIRVADEGPGLVATGSDVGRPRTGMGLLLVQRLAAMTGVELQFETPDGPDRGLVAVVRAGPAAPAVPQ